MSGTNRRDWGRLAKGMAIMLLLPATILFGTSGRLNWWMAWTYIGILAAITIGSRIIMLRKNPGLITERAQISHKDDVKSWDKTIMPIVAIFGPIITLVVIGLDYRFTWSPRLPTVIKITALALTTISYLLSAWATGVNRFFSAVVRIQRDRGHSVVTSGPYKYVRHPGYSGGIVANFTVPIALGSVWALLPAVLVACLTVLRTALEDRALQEELDGYRDYASRVRHRLMPGVW